MSLNLVPTTPERQQVVKSVHSSKDIDKFQPSMDFVEGDNTVGITMMNTTDSAHEASFSSTTVQDTNSSERLRDTQVKATTSKTPKNVEKVDHKSAKGKSNTTRARTAAAERDEDDDAEGDGDANKPKSNVRIGNTTKGANKSAKGKGNTTRARRAAAEEEDDEAEPENGSDGENNAEGDNVSDTLFDSDDN